MDDQSLLFLIIFYIIAFIYMKEENYKYFGYIMVLIMYLFTIILAFQDRVKIIAGGQQFIGEISSKQVVSSVFFIAFVAIIFFNIYSLFKIINAYWFKTKTMKSFDPKLSDTYKSKLRRFENSFIVGNVALAFLIFSFVLFPGPNQYKTAIQRILFCISFVCVWISVAYATIFSYIKRS